jgi:hypothetical protein
MVCYVSFEPTHDFHWKPGGANEAVIRMLISIGRFVAKTHDSTRAHDISSARKTCLASSKR